MPSPPSSPEASPSRPSRLPHWINPPGLGLAIGVGLAAAVLISPAFVTPVWVLMARTLFIALALLAAYTLVERCPESRLPFGWPRWLVALLALPLMALVATLLVYLVAVRGDVVSLATQADRISGFVITALAATVIAMPIALVAQVRAREQRVRAERLAFELERSRLEKQALDARLALLTAQIQPHFLFNTLANVQALVEAGSTRAPALLGSLIDYLRAAMPRLEAAEPRLADELKLVRAYLALMKMRMPDRLDWAVDVDDALAGLRFPPMALLTLVENAVRHGVDPMEDGGRIQVEGRVGAGQVRLAVVDDGAGLAEHTQPGTGLANLRERMAAFFGPEARLALSENPPHGLRAELTWPLAETVR